MRRFLLPILIITLAALGVWYLLDNAPKSQHRKAPPAPKLAVQVTAIKARDLQLTLRSYGQISAKNLSRISSQVSGRVTMISPALENGAFFNKGDILLQIDNRDYQAAINSARANLTQAQQALALERAQVSQAKADWKRLNSNSKIPSLVSRKPQELSAKAKVSAAHAQYDQAILNFQRTKILAPFAGRVLSKQVSLGELVNANSQLAEVFSSTILQVRLGLQNSDLAFIELPEATPLQAVSSATLPSVEFETQLIQKQFWRGSIVRTEAAIDSSSQQLFVIAEIATPFSAENADKHPLKIGQYVTAKIAGKNLQNVISIDIKSIYQGEFVYLVRDGLLHRQDIKIRWQNDQIALIGSGLQEGDQLVTTILAQAATGTAVNVNNNDSADGALHKPAKQGRKGNKGRKNKDRGNNDPGNKSPGKKQQPANN
ncbi:MAG: efflux RND transporter periplasmic adaptor subunit [Pseudomonadales bacterium]|nr:efflux RND transporter periplasmic adaptor subunit [Pseudomonadales bacterium]NRA13873.1 efflux RND transporter periplasmic adaptor subunit [Oceanospirillaceae bacterium]